MLSNPTELALEEINHEQGLEKLATKRNSEDVSQMKKSTEETEKSGWVRVEFPIISGTNRATNMHSIAGSHCFQDACNIVIKLVLWDKQDCCYSLQWCQGFIS